MQWVVLLSPRHRGSWNCLAQAPTAVGGGAGGPAAEAVFLTTPPFCRNFINPSSGPFTGGTREQLTLYSSTWSHLTPLTNSYLPASLRHPCLPSLTRVVKIGAWLTVIDGPSAIIPYLSWLTVNIYFLLHKNNEVSYRRWM